MIVASVFAVSLVSFAGLFFLSLSAAFTKRFLLLFVSFSAGAMFGDTFIHLLPEAVEENGFTIEVSAMVLFGILVFFALEKLIKWHHHHNVEHDHEIHSFGKMNLVGDGLHNFIDGVVIAGSYFVSVPVGLATTFAVVLHELPQEIGDFGVLLQSGYTRKQALFWNFLSALTAFLGAILGVYLHSIIFGFEVFMVAFTAGGFIYIAGSDLLPELHKESELPISVLQIISFMGGILVMALLLVLE